MEKVPLEGEKKNHTTPKKVREESGCQHGSLRLGPCVGLRLLWLRSLRLLLSRLLHDSTLIFLFYHIPALQHSLIDFISVVVMCVSFINIF